MAENEVTKSIKSTLANKLECYVEANNTNEKTKDYFGSNGMISTLFDTNSIKNLKTLSSCTGEDFSNEQVNYCSNAVLTWWQAYLLKKFDTDKIADIVELQPPVREEDNSVLPSMLNPIELDKKIIEKLINKLDEEYKNPSGPLQNGRKYIIDRLKENLKKIYIYTNTEMYGGKYTKLNIYACGVKFESAVVDQDKIFEFYKNELKIALNKDDIKEEINIVLKELIDYDGKTEAKKATKTNHDLILTNKKTVDERGKKEGDKKTNFKQRRRIENISNISTLNNNYYLKYVKYIITKKEFPFEGNEILGLTFGFDTINDKNEKDPIKELAVSIKEEGKVIPTINNEWINDKKDVQRYYSYDLQSLSFINESNNKEIYVFKDEFYIKTNSVAVTAGRGIKQVLGLSSKEVKNSIIYITADKIPEIKKEEYWADHYEGEGFIDLDYLYKNDKVAYEVKFRTKAEGENEYKDISKCFAELVTNRDLGIGDNLYKNSNGWIAVILRDFERTDNEYKKIEEEKISIELVNGNSANAGDTLYQVHYTKGTEDNGYKLYIQNNDIIIKPGEGEEIRHTTNPISYGDGVLHEFYSKEGYEELNKSEGIIPCFYTEFAGNVTYGTGCTFGVYDPNVAGLKRLWSAFFGACYYGKVGIGLSVKNAIKKHGFTEFLPANWENSWEGGSGGHLIFTGSQFQLLNGKNEPIQYIPHKIYFSTEQNKLIMTTPKKYSYFGVVKVSKYETSLQGYRTAWGSVSSAMPSIDYYRDKALENRADSLYTQIKLAGGVEGDQNLPLRQWCAIPEKRSPEFRPLTQKQWEALVSIVYQGWPSLASGGSLITIIKNKQDSYKELCRKIYLHANHEQSEYTQNWQYRGHAKKYAALFDPSKINTAPVANSKGDDIRREIVAISFRCFTFYDLIINSKVKYEERKDISFTEMSRGDTFYSRMYNVTIKPKEEEAGSEGGGGNGGPSKEELNWENVKETIDKWTCKLGNNTEPKEQYLVDVNRYYDFYSEMAPYIELAFRKYDSSGNKGWNVINSIKHPYIKNLFVEDKGVKTATITLFDKDFNSYQKGILTSLNEPRGNGNEKECVYSLESLIRSSLISMDITTGETDKKELKYNEDIINTTEQLKDSFIKFVEDAQASDPTNLCIRFGYCDLNQTFHMKTEGDIVRSTDEASVKMINYFEKEKNATKRNARWWQFKNDTTVRTISAIPNFVIRGNSLESNDGKFELSSLGDQIITTDKDEGNRDVKLNGVDQTTLITPYRMYMIVGYETKLQTNGILYTIKAIESTLGETLRKRFLQRYSEITSYPLEILYILIKIFNESYTGEINKNSKIKIYYLDDLGKGTDGFNMLFDFSGMDPKEAQKFGEIKDYYYSRNVKVETIDKKWLKKASIRFGTEEALSRNSSRNEGKPNLYKNVSSLINEFCAICPARKEWDETEEELKAYDGNGNEVIGDKYKSSAPLGWFVARLGKNGASKDEEKLDNETYIVLYYKKPVKLGKIRLYRWGPALTGKTVVRSIDVKNNNEFAILSGVNSFSNVPNGVKQSIKLNYNNIGSGTKPVKENAAGQMSSTISSDKLNEEYEKNNGMILTGYVNPTEIQANKFDAAFSSSMYTGSITLLGDPCLEFDMTIQPYCYPIRLEVVVPYNETYFRDVQVRQEINKGEFGHQFPYGSTGRYHEITRYYVITSITHNIGIDGYTTTLGISSYPGIENDILINPNASTKLPIL